MFSYLEEVMNPTIGEVSGFRITGEHGAAEPMNPEERSRASERDTERECVWTEACKASHLRAPLRSI